MALYQGCWDILKDDLLEVIFEFHSFGIIKKCINSTVIVLIPKKVGGVLSQVASEINKGF